MLVFASRPSVRLEADLAFVMNPHLIIFGEMSVFARFQVFVINFLSEYALLPTPLSQRADQDLRSIMGG